MHSSSQETQYIPKLCSKGAQAASINTHGWPCCFHLSGKDESAQRQPAFRHLDSSLPAGSEQHAMVEDIVVSHQHGQRITVGLRCSEAEVQEFSHTNLKRYNEVPATTSTTRMPPNMALDAARTTAQMALDTIDAFCVRCTCSERFTFHGAEGTPGGK